MYLGAIPHGAAPYEEFFSWGSRHHCPIEVGAYEQDAVKQARFYVFI